MKKTVKSAPAPEKTVPARLTDIKNGAGRGPAMTAAELLPPEMARELAKDDKEVTRT